MKGCGIMTRLGHGVMNGVKVVEAVMKVGVVINVGSSSAHATEMKVCGIVTKKGCGVMVGVSTQGGVGKEEVMPLPRSLTQRPLEETEDCCDATSLSRPSNLDARAFSLAKRPDVSWAMTKFCSCRNSISEELAATARLVARGSASRAAKASWGFEGETLRLGGEPLNACLTFRINISSSPMREDGGGKAVGISST